MVTFSISCLTKRKLCEFILVTVMSWDDPLPTWRIIPGLGYVVNDHGDRKSPKDRVVGPLPNGRFMAYKWGLLTTY